MTTLIDTTQKQRMQIDLCTRESLLICTILSSIFRFCNSIEGSVCNPITFQLKKFGTHAVQLLWCYADVRHYNGYNNANRIQSDSALGWGYNDFGFCCLWIFLALGVVCSITQLGNISA